LSCSRRAGLRVRGGASGGVGGVGRSFGGSGDITASGDTGGSGDITASGDTGASGDIAASGGRGGVDVAGDHRCQDNQ
jgi:hypothetical protein